MKHSIFLSLISFFIFITFMLVQEVSGQDSISATEIRFLIDEEASLRQQLESRIQRLRQRVSDLNSTIQPCNCVPVTPAPRPQIAYTGTLASTMSGISTATVFNFTDDLVNEGKPYDFQYAHFVAPLSGIYGFSLATYIASTGYIFYFELIVDTLSVMYTKTGHYSSRQPNMATNFILLNLTQGAEVWPRYSYGSGYLYGDGVTSFSGYLVQPF